MFDEKGKQIYNIIINDNAKKKNYKRDIEIRKQKQQ